MLIHAVTTKGKGYEFAEKNPKGFHGTAPFDVDTGLTMVVQNLILMFSEKLFVRLRRKTRKFVR